MRLSIEEEDPGYGLHEYLAAQGKKITVTLNGKPQSHVITVDDMGYVKAYKTTEAGEPVSCGTNFATEELRGPVVITIE